MAAAPLAAAQVSAALAALPGWSHQDNALHRAWRFPSFAAAIAFFQECAPDIERLDHHPEWTNVYDLVRARLATHDAGDRVTAKDVELAKILEWKASAMGAADG